MTVLRKTRITIFTVVGLEAATALASSWYREHAAHVHVPHDQEPVPVFARLSLATGNPTALMHAPR